MQGYKIVAYIGAELKSEFKRPVNATHVVKSHASTLKSAREEKRRMEQLYNGVVLIRG